MNPRHVGSLPEPDGMASVVGPCADSMGMWLQVDEEKVAMLTFWTDGCGPTIACGSVTTELAIGKTIEDAQALRAEDVLEALGGLPTGHTHCAQLAIDTLQATIKDYHSNRKQPWWKLRRRK